MRTSDDVEFESVGGRTEQPDGAVLQRSQKPRLHPVRLLIRVHFEVREGAQVLVVPAKTSIWLCAASTNAKFVPVLEDARAVLSGQVGQQPVNGVRDVARGAQKLTRSYILQFGIVQFRKVDGNAVDDAQGERGVQ